MKTTYISTAAVHNATRRSVLEMQSELADRQKELVSGRLADVGLTLGARTGQAVALRQEHASLQAIVDSNIIASGRLSSTQAALEGIAEGAHEFLSILIDAQHNHANVGVTQERAGELLSSLVSDLNATHAGEHLFSGINTAVAPIAGYTDGSPAKQAVEDAFVARFGFTQSDPAVASISGANMQDFLDNEFAALFDDAGWAANWSSASDQTTSVRISSGTSVTTGVSANQPAMRKLAMAYTMMADLGLAGLSEGAYDAVASKATGLAGEALQQTTQMQAHLGSSQQTVSNASERMAAQMDVLATHVGKLENVDPYEASTRVTALLTQIETSYAMTARIQRLSLLNYL